MQRGPHWLIRKTCLHPACVRVKLFMSFVFNENHVQACFDGVNNTCMERVDSASGRGPDAA